MLTGTSRCSYQRIGSSEVKQITANVGLKDSPVVSEDRNGEVRIVWEDQRAGTVGANWDIYAYDLSSQTERKLNASAGKYGQISIDGNLAVWAETSTSEMYLHDFQKNQTVQIGKGRFPVVSEGRIVYISAFDGGLILYTVNSGQTERILELPYHQYVDWFAFKHQTIVWKQRNLDLQSQFVMLNLGENPKAPVELTKPSVKAKEYSSIYIGDGQAAWLEYRGSAVQVVGADLYTGQTYQVTNSDCDQQLLGIEGNRIIMVDEKNQLLYRTVIRTEIPASSGGVMQAPGTPNAIEADGAKLVLGDTDSDLEAHLEPVDLESLDAKWPASPMRLLSKGWKVVSELPFKSSAVLTIQYDANGVTSSQARKIGLYQYDANEKSWRFIGGRADAETGQLTANIPGSGIYAANMYEPSFRDMLSHWAQQKVKLLKWRIIFTMQPIVVKGLSY